MAVVHVKNDNFEEVVMKSEKPVLVDFWASWCGPCKMLSPIVDEIGEGEDRFVVAKVNVDEEQELAARFRVMSIPTLIVFHKGQAVKTSVGAKPKNEIISMMEEILA